ncbi:hypothetical protein [Salinispora arenicola]|uniref:hypothetical protein n=1 Tax=Salinispora arenicola TaxID=168697 RepID=UPI00207A6AB4|nr:hypothetical protein [Salinispora arenicola]MCN0152542.1 hypothetical protein [Salinispora arenicola]
MLSSNRMWLHQLRKCVGLTLVVTLLSLAFGALPARANAVDGLILNLDVNYSGFTTDFYPESGWRVKEGPDGVEVAFPQEWGYTWGADGRLVAYPRSGWRVKEGPDERAIAYPQEWGYTWGGDGRLVAYPHSGWRLDERSDERLIAFPEEWFKWGQIIPSPPSGSLSLMFTSASNQALVVAAEASLTPDEFRDYVIMQYIQQEIVARG